MVNAAMVDCASASADGGASTQSNATRMDIKAPAHAAQVAYGSIELLLRQRLVEVVAEPVWGDYEENLELLAIALVYAPGAGFHAIGF